MAYPDAEDVADGVRQIFMTQFPGNLAAVDARKSTPLNPFSPEEYRFGETKNEPAMPAMLFLSDETGTDQDEEGWRRQSYSCAIEAYYTDQDIETLERIVRRYGAAIDDTLRNNQRLGDLAAYVRTITKIRQRFTAIGSSNNRLMQGVRVEFEVILNTD